MQNKPLDGLRVTDFGWILSIPHATAWLGTLGADVVRVETEVRLDLIRVQGMNRGVDGVLGLNRSGAFNGLNYSKRGVTLNLQKPEGRELALRLVEQSDIVTENFSTGVIERLGLGYEELCKVNPNIILASVSGFGQYGPYRDRQCFDPIIQAMSGFGDQTGRGFGEPIMGNGPVMDRTAALHAVIGILGALRHRDRTGEGQWLEVAMLDGGITLEEVALAMCYETNTNDFVRVGTFLKCKDGWVTTGAARAGMWERMLKVMDYDELAKDPEFAAPMFATDMAEIRMELLRMWCEERTVAEVEEALVAADIPFGPVKSIPEVLADSHMWEREVMMEADAHEPPGQKILVPGPTIIKFSKTPTTAGPIPRYGEHNQEIYGDLLGLSEPEMAGLADQGVITC